MMAPKGVRDTRIRDLLRYHGRFDSIASSLGKNLGPEIGGLNVRQSEGILALMEVVNHTMLAIGAINNELNELFTDKGAKLVFGDALISIDKNGEIVLATGDASIRMKKDGTIDIKGKDIRVIGSGEINIRASKEMTLKGSKIQQN
jgi:hypothetical protein